MKKLLNRRGRIAAVDYKFTGEEPEWDGWETWDLNTFFSRKLLALKFYTYYLDNAAAKSIAYSWMKKNGYTKEKLNAFDAIAPRQIPTTIGKVARMLDMGMPDIHPRAKEYYTSLQPYEGKPSPRPRKCSDILHEEIAAVIKSDDKVFAEEPPPQKKRVDPISEIDKNVLCHLEDWIENICQTKPTRVVAVDILGLISAAKVPKTLISYIEKSVAKTAEEFKGAYEKSDSQLVEGYSYLGRPLLRKICECYDNMLTTLRGLSGVKTTTRKPRVKKPRAVEKQIANLKYLEACETYAVKSIHPNYIPGSHVLYVFNTKNRYLGVYYSSGRGGFEVKGCSIKNYDPDKSFMVTLRKPNDFLHTIQGNANKKVEKLIESVSTKRKPANGRINAHTLLLKTHEN